MAVFLSWSPKVGPPKTLFFDVCKEEDAEFSSVVTDHPVESGANVADHVRRQLMRVSLDVFVSNSPIYDWNFRGGQLRSLNLAEGAKQSATGSLYYKAPLEPTPGAVFGAVGKAVKGAIGSLMGGDKGEPKANVFQWNSEFDAVADTIEVLERLRKDVQLVSIVTPHREHESMFLETFRVNRNAGTGDGASFRLSFREIRMVEAKILNAPIPTEIRGHTAKSKGNKGPAEAKAPEQKKRDVSFLKAVQNRVLGR